jgi:predicted phosphodiesterase
MRRLPPHSRKSEDEMNQVTIFGDIHANLPALDTVLADMDVRLLATRYCLGDLVGYGTFPNEAEHKAFLRALPAKIPLQLGDLRVMLAHGSPRRVSEYLFADRPDSSLERLLDMVEADVMVCGHTHLPYHRVLPSGRHVVKAGSVGKPKNGDRRPRRCAPYAACDVRSPTRRRTRPARGVPVYVVLHRRPPQSHQYTLKECDTGSQPGSFCSTICDPDGNHSTST